MLVVPQVADWNAGNAIATAVSAPGLDDGVATMWVAFAEIV